MPEYPEYVDVPPQYADACHVLVEAGICEYAPRTAPISEPTKVDRRGFPVRKPSR
jgi:hypothetical protein